MLLSWSQSLLTTSGVARVTVQPSHQQNNFKEKKKKKKRKTNLHQIFRRSKTLLPHIPFRFESSQKSQTKLSLPRAPSTTRKTPIPTLRTEHSKILANPSRRSSSFSTPNLSQGFDSIHQPKRKPLSLFYFILFCSLCSIRFSRIYSMFLYQGFITFSVTYLPVFVMTCYLLTLFLFTVRRPCNFFFNYQGFPYIL